MLKYDLSLIPVFILPNDLWKTNVFFSKEYMFVGLKYN